MMWVAAVAAATWAQSPTMFTRPGSMVVTDVVADATIVEEGKERPAVIEERIRAEVVFKTGRRSTLAVEFSNGATIRLGANSEVVVDEFWQQPHSDLRKAAEWKEEPSPSMARLRLVNGDVAATVKRLKTERGASFAIEMVAGVLRVMEGSVSARVQMTELGLGLCTVRLGSGVAEFEPAGGKPVALAAGRTLSFAVEVDDRGTVKVSEAPVANAAGK